MDLDLLNRSLLDSRKGTGSLSSVAPPPLHGTALQGGDEQPLAAVDSSRRE
jgi:hypothetical protein